MARRRRTSLQPRPTRSVLSSMLAFICAFGALQLLLIASAFAFVSTPSRRWFAAVATVVSIIVGGSALMESRLIAALPHAARLHLPFMYLVFPLFYFFVRSEAGEEPPRHAWLHGIPAFACFLLLLPFYLSDGTVKLTAIEHRDVWVTVRLLALLVQGAVYLPPTFAVLLRRGSRDRFLWASMTAMTLLWIGAMGRLGEHLPPLLIPSCCAVCAMAMVTHLLHGRIAPRVK